MCGSVLRGHGTLIADVSGFRRWIRDGNDCHREPALPIFRAIGGDVSRSRRRASRCPMLIPQANLACVQQSTIFPCAAPFVVERKAIFLPLVSCWSERLLEEAGGRRFLSFFGSCCPLPLPLPLPLFLFWGFYPVQEAIAIVRENREVCPCYLVQRLAIGVCPQIPRRESRGTPSLLLVLSPSRASPRRGGGLHISAWTRRAR